MLRGSTLLPLHCFCMHRLAFSVTFLLVGFSSSYAQWVLTQADRTWTAPVTTAKAPITTTDAFFIDDHRIATKICAGQPPCRITLLGASATLTPELTAPAPATGELAQSRGMLHPGAPGQLIDVREIVDEATLQSQGKLPGMPPVLSDDRTLMATGDFTHWCVRAIGLGTPCTSKGRGRLIALSPALIVLGNNFEGNLSLVGPDGAALTELTFPACNRKRNSFFSQDASVTTLGVVVNRCSVFTMYNTQGKALWHQPSNPAGSFAVAASRNGKRLLLVEDRYQVWLGRTITDYLQTLPSMGERGPSEDPNLLLLTVLEGTTGRVCYHREIRFSQGGLAPVADLSPDGRQILIGWQGTLTLNTYPDACTHP